MNYLHFSHAYAQIVEGGNNGPWKSLIVCSGPDCNFAKVIELIRVVINDLTYLATLLTVIGCIYVGFKLVTSQGNAGALKDAKSRGTTLLLGYVIILAAWIIVHTITSTLLKDGYSLV